jgi:hypothetical protein
MSTFRRIMISVGAPLVVVAGLAVLWGVRNASQLKAQIETWADSLQHSPNPVTMDLSFLPMYIEGHRVGKIDAVVVQRHQPGTVDSVRIDIMTGGHVDPQEFANCRLHLDPDAFDRDGPLGFKHALSCVEDTSEMVRFGSVNLEGLDEVLALYLNAADLPCQHMAEDAVECTQLQDEIQKLREEIRREVRIRVR